MAWKVKVVDGPDRGIKAAVGTGQFLIGRDPSSSSLVLTDSAVSRNHARIQVNPDGSLHIEDLNSSNGTFINNQSISGAVELRSGDEVLIGGNRLQLLWDDSPVVSPGHELSEEGAYRVGDEEGQALSIAQALTAPFRDRGFFKWLLGSILAIIPLLSFFSDGYRFRLLQNGMAGKFILPEWDNLGELFLKGLLFFIIRLLYLLLPTILLFVYIFMFSRGQDLFLALIVLIYAIIGFFLPMGLAHFASDGTIARAFQFGAIIQSIRAVFLQYMLALLIFSALWVVFAVLALIPFIGWLFSVFGVFYAYIVSSLLYGELYRRSRITLGY